MKTIETITLIDKAQQEINQRKSLGEKINTRKELIKLTGLSSGTIAKYQYIIKSGFDYYIQSMLCGDLSLNETYKSVKFIIDNKHCKDDIYMKFKYCNDIISEVHFYISDKKISKCDMFYLRYNEYDKKNINYVTNLKEKIIKHMVWYTSRLSNIQKDTTIYILMSFLLKEKEKKDKRRKSEQEKFEQDNQNSWNNIFNKINQAQLNNTFDDEETKLLKEMFKLISKKYHPDMPTGDTDTMQKINNLKEKLNI